jgi:predicted transcriptional regulator
MTRPSSAPALVHDEPSVDLRLVHDSQGATERLIGKIVMDRLTPAQALRMCRQQCKWTIGRAATNFGVTSNTWSNYELGRVTVPADALLWIVRKCEELGR